MDETANALKNTRETLMMVRDCFARDMTQPFRERLDESINLASRALGFKPKKASPTPSIDGDRG